jgi:hypothetical protein
VFHSRVATNSIIGWEGMRETNTLAYYEHSKITNVKSFITLGPRACNIKLLRIIIAAVL